MTDLLNPGQFGQEDWLGPEGSFGDPGQAAWSQSGAGVDTGGTAW